MKKKCIMCGETAEYLIKDTNDAYCKTCAVDCFTDVSFLQKVEDVAVELKRLVKEEIQEEIDDRLKDQ